jgi:hypothetical protein
VTLASRRNIKWGKNALQGSGNPNFSGGRYVDDKGYIRVLSSDHPYNNKGYVYMHRLVYEKHIGRYLEPWEIIHHINEIKLDNRIENFFLTTVPEHSAIHRSGRIESLESRTKRRMKIRQKPRRKRNNAGQFENGPEKGV